MIVLTLSGLNNLNVSLQVGDAIYARRTKTQGGANDPQVAGNLGSTFHIGTLVQILQPTINTVQLFVNDDEIATPYAFQINDFIMFSKFEQGDSGVLGYYAEAKFINDSKQKAELFAVSSEVIMNSN